MSMSPNGKGDEAEARIESGSCRSQRANELDVDYSQCDLHVALQKWQGDVRSCLGGPSALILVS